MPGTGTAIGAGAGAIAGSFIPGIGTVAGGFIGGALGGMAEELFGGSDAPAAPQGTYVPIDPNVGIGFNTFGLTPEEQAVINSRRQDLDRLYGSQQDAEARMRQAEAAMEQYKADWKQANPQGAEPVENSRGAVSPGARQQANTTAMMNDPQYQRLASELNQYRSQVSQYTHNLNHNDMSDPGRFAAMSQSVQNRQGLNLPQFSVAGTANPEIYQMQRQNAPQIYDPGQYQRAQTFNAREFDVDKTKIDPNAGEADYAAYQQARAKNLEVMGAVGDRAMGRGGPSPAELQMKQGQDRAIAQQAALAASGGQMDSAMARRQAMLGAAQIGQRTASDTALLRANEQIAAQNTYGGMNSAQQAADLGAMGQRFGQAERRAINDWQQNIAAAQFGSDQAFRNAQFNAQQSQFNAGQANQFNLSRAQTMAQQGQFGAQFGLSQEQAIAQSLAQQRQFNAQFGQQQNQFNAQFGAQQALNQAQMTMQQRAMNDQMTGMYLNQYMNSRGMQQQNAFQNQNAYNQMAGINAGVGINNANLAGQNQRFQQQQQLGMLNMGATMAAGYMGQGGGGGTPSPVVANSGFNQSNPHKIDWGY